MTEMSRIERKKMEREKAQAELALKAQEEPQFPEEELPSRQSYREKKKSGKKKNKQRNPLFTSLAVIFLFIPIIVFLVFMYMMNQSDTNPDQYDDVFYEKSKDTSFLDDQAADQRADSRGQAAAFQEEKADQTEEKADDQPKKEAAEERPTEERKTEDKPSKVEKKAHKPAAAEKKSEEKTATEKKNVAKAPAQKAPEPKKVIQHTVGEKETLYRISMKYYKDRSGEEKIRNYNQLSGNNVYTGQVLKIPFY